jgi:hypothetical protein
LNFRSEEARAKEVQRDDVCSQIFINSAQELVGWLDERVKECFFEVMSKYPLENSANVYVPPTVTRAHHRTKK